MGAAERFQLTAELVDRHWTPNTRGVMAASPANPTGTTVPDEELRAIHDVVRPYGARGLVAIAETVAEFVAAIDGELRRADRRRWLGEVDDFLAEASWDATWDGMQRLISAVAPAGERAAARPARPAHRRRRSDCPAGTPPYTPRH